MSHTVKTLPDHFSRNRWLEGGKSALARILSDRDAVSRATPVLIRDALLDGSWRPTSEDISGDFDALSALMGSYHCRDADAALITPSDTPLVAMTPEEQEIALFLSNLGCSITTRFPDYFSDADVMDMALVLSADAFLEKHLDQVDWKSRLIMDLPWLHFAARRGLASVVKLLIDRGADIEQPDAAGNTPLFHASGFEVVDLLVQAGADAFCFNTAGRTPQAYWETDRSIKGDQNRQMVASLGKATRTLTREQEIEQVFVMAQTAAKGRLVKEIRRLKMKGEERVDGLGLLSSATLRSLSTVQDGQTGAKGNNDRNWMEFVGTWSGALSAATPGELAQAFLVASMIEAIAAKSAIHEAFQARGLDKKEEDTSWIGAIEWILRNQKDRLGSSASMLMVDLLANRSDAIETVPLMMEILSPGRHRVPPFGPMLTVCSVLNENPTHSMWSNLAVLHGMVDFCLANPRYNQKVQDAQVEVMQWALVSAEKASGWSSHLRQRVGKANTPRSYQLDFIDRLSSILDAGDLSHGAPTVSSVRRSPRL